MIFFGTGTREMDPVKMENVECPNCGQEALYLTLIHRYFHVYRIPAFPVGKEAEATCKACRKLWEGPKMVGGMVEASKLAKKNASTPRYLFAGVYIVGAIILITTYMSWKDDRNTAEYVRDPHVADYYIVHTDIDKAYPHIVLFVNDIRGDSMEMLVGKYGYHEPRHAEKAITGGAVGQGYFVDTMVFSRADLQTMFDNKNIPQIVRVGD